MDIATGMQAEIINTDVEFSISGSPWDNPINVVMSSDGNKLFLLIWSFIVEVDVSGQKPVGHPSPKWTIVAGRPWDFGRYREGPGHFARFGNLLSFASLSPDDKILYFTDRITNSELILRCDVVLQKQNRLLGFGGGTIQSTLLCRQTGFEKQPLVLDVCVACYNNA